MPSSNQPGTETADHSSTQNCTTRGSDWLGAESAQQPQNSEPNPLGCFSSTNGQLKSGQGREQPSPRVDHWAGIRDRSTFRPAPPKLPSELNPLEVRIAELTATVERLCAHIEMEKLSEGPGAAHRIARSVAKKHHISFTDLISARRSVHLVRARQEAMWLMRKYTVLSLPHIGKILGNRDHTTVLHGIRAFEARNPGASLAE